MDAATSDVLKRIYNLTVQRAHEASGLGEKGSELAEKFTEVMITCMHLMLNNGGAGEQLFRILEDIQELEMQLETEKKGGKKSRGGARAGAGKKKMGLPQGVTITLPPEDWKRIDERIQRREFRSRSEYFRKLHVRFKEEGEIHHE